MTSLESQEEGRLNSNRPFGKGHPLVPHSNHHLSSWFLLILEHSMNICTLSQDTPDYGVNKGIGDEEEVPSGSAHVTNTLWSGMKSKCLSDQGNHFCIFSRLQIPTPPMDTFTP